MNEKNIKPRFISVPFTAESPNGMMHYSGIAKFSFAGIVLEYESKILGLVGNEVKQVQVALDDIMDIRLRKGIYKFFTQIQLRLNNYQKISQLPNNGGGKIKLSVKRVDHDRAREAVDQTLLYLNGVDPSALKEANDTNDQLPPVQTSVSELFDTEKLSGKDS